MGQLTAFGLPTKTVFLNDIEAHKLHIAFTVAPTMVIKKGMPLKLNATGEVITVVGDGSDSHQIIGYSIHDGIAGDVITLGVRGFAVVYAKAKTAIVPGAVIYTGQDSVDSSLGNYDDTGATAANYHGWSLDSALALHDTIRVLLK